MGCTYGNVVLLATGLEAVRPLVSRPALVRQVGTDVLVAAAVDDPVPTSGAALSGALGCTAVGSSVHDDDLLVVEVHRDGALVLAGALPDPAEVFGVEAVDAGDAASPKVLTPADAPALVAAVGRGDPMAVAAVLAADELFASIAHARLLQALVLPGEAARAGHALLLAAAGGMERFERLD